MFSPKFDYYTTGWPLNLESWKNRNFDSLGFIKEILKKPGILNNFYMLSSKI